MTSPRERLTEHADDIRTLIADLDAQAVALTERDATIGRLTAELAACQGGSKPGMAVGVNVSANTRPNTPYATLVAEAQATFDSPDLGRHVRWFDGGKGIKAAVDEWESAGSLPDPVFSFKTYDKPSFDAAMTRLAGRPWSACYFHEPEDDGAAGTYAAKPKTYLDVYQQMNDARLRHPNGGDVTLVKALLGYRETEQIVPGFVWRAYDGGQRFDRLVIAGDCYSARYLAKPHSPEYLFGWLVEWHKASGLPFAVTELGVATHVKKSGTLTPLDPQVRADVIAGYLAYLAEADCSWVQWWSDGDTGNGDWRLQPGTPAHKVWVDAMHA